MDSYLLDHTSVYGDRDRLHIHPSAGVHNAYFNVMSGDITIERDVFFGHRVSLLAGTHDYSTFGQQRRNAFPRHGCDIVVEEGAWLATNATIIGPCRIGRHSVVAAGSVVNGDVAPYTMVAGVPAIVMKVIDCGETALPGDASS